MEMTPTLTGQILKSNILPPTGVTTARVASSPSWASAVATVHSSFSLSAQVSIVSTTVADASSVPSRLLSSSFVCLCPFSRNRSRAALSQKTCRAR